ncbi:arrestin domain-containing protein 17-like [Achroia grisella]|uniref:arrestin domain-containing protein 17-like n=1 Tax=Achroia grisella TaxID=688607 RepID=UPI0027D332DB|nr:arrestin domain-containing protein 17-like [Achroia grisella]
MLHSKMEAGFKNGVITLNEPKSVYYAGQEISGNVHFKLDTTLTFKAITLQITGAARVLWNDNETVKYHDKKYYGEVTYKGTEEYFNEVRILCGGKGASQLQPQSYTLSFKFQIPHTVPSSFKGNKGQVLYNIVAYIEFPDPLMPWQELTKAFTVIAPYNLYNNLPKINEPLKLVFDETLTSGCLCSPRPLNITIELPRSGFCPGDTIPIRVNAVNDSDVKVLSIILKIVVVSRYRSQTPRAELTSPEWLLVEGRTAPVAAHSRRSFVCDLILPRMMVYDLSKCSLIDVTYYFKAILKLSAWNGKRERSSEIKLGMIPTDKTTVTWGASIADQLPKNPPPAPGAPTVPGITTFDPGFNVTPGPRISWAFPAHVPSMVEIGFRTSNGEPNASYGFKAPYPPVEQVGMYLPTTQPPYPLSMPSAPSIK